MLDDASTYLHSVPRKLLIVEGKLIRNRGHHHTQVAGLKALLPDCQYGLLAGDEYDGFLGEAVATFPSGSSRFSRLINRAKHGDSLRKIVARTRLLLEKKSLRLPNSPFLASLSEASKKLELGPNDLIIVPSAELDALEGSIALISQMKERTPHVCLRFLGQSLGETNDAMRNRRLAALNGVIPNTLQLFTETEELARYLEAQFSAPVIGQFYMPCGMELARGAKSETGRPDVFRVGVFGPARREKGSKRLSAIIRDIFAEIDQSSRRIEFVVQGSNADFARDGVYGDLALSALPCDKRVAVERHDDRLSPERWTDVFKSVDAVLLPYDVDIYGLQGSGVVQDAVVACKLILYSKGMAMKELMQHGNGIPAASDMEFAKAVILASQMSRSEVENGTKKALAYYRLRMLDHPLLRALNKIEDALGEA